LPRPIRRQCLRSTFGHRWHQARHSRRRAPHTLANRPAGRRPSRHSFGALNRHRGVRRGFLPRGLCDTCPQVVPNRRAVALAGQVSHNPKQYALSAFALHNGHWQRDRLNERCLCASPPLADPLLTVGRPTSLNGPQRNVASWSCLCGDDWRAGGQFQVHRCRLAGAAPVSGVRPRPHVLSLRPRRCSTLAVFDSRRPASPAR
jgi:hypothetical protein